MDPAVRVSSTDGGLILLRQVDSGLVISRKLAA